MAAGCRSGGRPCSGAAGATAAAGAQRARGRRRGADSLGARLRLCEHSLKRIQACAKPPRRHTPAACASRAAARADAPRSQAPPPPVAPAKPGGSDYKQLLLKKYLSNEELVRPRSHCFRCYASDCHCMTPRPARCAREAAGGGARPGCYAPLARRRAGGAATERRRPLPPLPRNTDRRSGRMSTSAGAPSSPASSGARLARAVAAGSRGGCGAPCGGSRCCRPRAASLRARADPAPPRVPCPRRPQHRQERERAGHLGPRDFKRAGQG